MVKKAIPAASKSKKLTADELLAGAERLKRRLSELENFNPTNMTEGYPAELARISTSISSSLARTFGEDTAEYRRFIGAATLGWRPTMITMGRPTPISDYIRGTSSSVERAKAILGSAILALEEELGEQPALGVAAEKTDRALSRRVFVVHGHDGEARETVARFLENLRFNAVILHEQANRGRTVIEKVEAETDVSFAVVILTPDDIGCAVGGTPEPRARQNVLLELGYFIGFLGRANVCALKRGEVEIPSDFAGVVWNDMDGGGGWKMSLARELVAAGHEIDWNAVMR